MGYNAAPLEKLIEEFGKFPGIGRKGATRMAYQVLSMSDADAAALAESMTNFGFDRALYGFEREGFSAIRDAYKARCVNLGRHVTFDGGEGTALDVDEEGRLVVQGAEGSTHVFTGEVSVHGIYGAV